MSIHYLGNFDITLGVMDEPELFKASKHIWNKSQISHVNIVDDLPQFQEGDT